MLSAHINPHLLIVEDDIDFRDTLKDEFEDRGYRVTTVGSHTEAESQLNQENFQFAIVDLRLKSDRGLDVVSTIHHTQNACRIVVLTGYGSIATAVEAIKRGAVNYLTKPVPIERLEKALWIDEENSGQETQEENFESLERHEQEYLEYVLQQCDGNISQAAKRLKIHRQSLQRKLKRWGLK